jgi:hypothetical protein
MAQRVTKPTSVSARHRKRSEHHHGSHRSLLDERPKVDYPSDVDAIIVPTNRNVAMLESAIQLASKLKSTLVVLCSMWSSAKDVAEAVKGKGVGLIAVDISRLPAGLVPSFETCQVLASARLERKTDTSLKRNFGLLLARLIGWQRIVFLDDDIQVPEPTDLSNAVALTEDYAGVGLAIEGMPDNSVVCHAFREAGGAQEMFIGGGALAIGAKSMTSFFPNIYNEAWFFLLDENGLRPTAITGRAIQKEYDPFREQRARGEELGDCLAEGLFWLLDNGRSLQDATEGHWRGFLRARREFITDVIGMVERMDGEPSQRHRMLLALKAARGRNHSIKPELCVNFVKAWRNDRARWSDHLAELHRKHGIEGPIGKGRSVDEVRAMFRSMDVPDHVTQLHLPPR